MHCTSRFPKTSLLNPEVEECLRKASETLADLYHSSLCLFQQYDPCNPSARITLSYACYSMRDLINDLPDSFPGQEDVPHRSGDEHFLIRNLIAALDRKPLTLGSTESQQERIVIDREVAKSLYDLYQYERKATDVSNRRLLLGVSHLGSYGGPAAIPWKAANNFFQAHTHVRSSSSNKLPSKSEVLRHVEVINDVLSLKVGQYFATKTKLQTLLETANELDEDGNYTTPTDELITKVLSNLGDVGLRFVFFNNLENPEWVRVLSDKGTFDLTARPIETGLFAQWPEGDYLRRMSSYVPGNVCKAFCSVENWSNPSVIRSALGALANMKSGEGEVLLQQLARAAQDDNWFDSYTWNADAVLEAIRSTTNGNERLPKACKNLARQCLMPKAPKTKQYSSEPVACVPSYQYNTLLAGVIKLLPITSAFGLVKELIDAYSSTLENLRGETLGWWIPSIAYAINSERPNIGNDLVRSMAEVLHNQLLNCPNMFELSLNEKNGAIIRRISLFVLQEEYERDPQGAPESVKNLVKRATNSSFACDWNCDAEYFPLVRLAADNNIDLSILWESLPTYIEASEEGIVQKSIASGASETDSQIIANHSATYRKYRILSLIGEQRLPSNLRQSLTNLSDKFEERRFDDVRIVETGWISPHSPLSATDMKAMGPLALLKRLSEIQHTAEEAGARNPFRGIARELTDLVCNNPLFFDDLESELEKLCPEYLNSILIGWDAALMRSRNIPLHTALPLCKFALGTETERATYKTPEAIELTQAALALLDHLPNSSAHKDELCNWANMAISALVTFAETHPVDLQEEQSMREDGWDEMTVSVNIPRSDALATIIDWLNETDDVVTLDKAKALLERHLPSQSESTADAAIFGRQIAKLEYGKHECLKHLALDIYGGPNPNRAQKTALSVTLAAYQPSAQLLKLLVKPMQTALEIGATTYPVGWSAAGADTESRIGIWLMTAFTHSAIEFQSAVFKAWDRFSLPESKRFALCRICHAIGNDGNTKAQLRNRAMRLCDHYIKFAENNDSFLMPAEAIMHLALNRAFSTQWWAPYLVKTMQLEPNIDVLLLMEQELIELSTFDPDSALDILMNGIKDTSKGGLEVYMAQKMSPAILANALERNDAALEKRVATCMDELGFLGIVDLDERTELFRNGLRDQREHDDWTPPASDTRNTLS